MSNDLIADLTASGFSYLSFDLSKGASVTAWHRNDRRTHFARGANLTDALTALLTPAESDDEILGDLL